MIDLHSHLLPGIDDGAPDVKASMFLAHHAVSAGITHMVLTPHIHPGRYENDIHSITQAHDLFRQALEQESLQLKTEIAAEVRISVEMLTMIQLDSIPFIGELDGYKILLLEMPHSHILPGAEKLVDHLLKQKIRPMIAHPERNKDVIRNLDKIRPFVEQGCLLQVTAGSVAGDFGESAQRRAEEIVANGWAYVLASDAHNANRLPVLENGRKAAASLIGEDESWKLVRDNPWSIVDGRF